MEEHIENLEQNKKNLDRGKNLIVDGNDGNDGNDSNNEAKRRQ
jgi:hypothetical protein